MHSTSYNSINAFGSDQKDDPNAPSYSYSDVGFGIDNRVMTASINREAQAQTSNCFGMILADSGGGSSSTNSGATMTGLHDERFDQFCSNGSNKGCFGATLPSATMTAHKNSTSGWPVLHPQFQRSGSAQQHRFQKQQRCFHWKTSLSSPSQEECHNNIRPSSIDSEWDIKLRNAGSQQLRQPQASRSVFALTNNEQRQMKKTPVVLEEVSQALNELSFDERQNVYNDLHGIPKTAQMTVSIPSSGTSADEEKSSGASITPISKRKRPVSINPETIEDDDPSYVVLCLDEMYKRLVEQYWTNKKTKKDQKSSDLCGAALNLAMDTDISYVQNREFRLMFLRKEDFNVSKAIDIFVDFLECKLQLFGPTRLTKEITIQQDLVSQMSDFKCLVSGGLQHVPLKDQSGRPIMIRVSKLEYIENDENLVSLSYVTGICILAALKEGVPSLDVCLGRLYLCLQRNLRTSNSSCVCLSPITARCRV